jgi:hypothetical protein
MPTTANTNSGAIVINGGSLDMVPESGPNAVTPDLTYFNNSGTIDLEQKGTLTITGDSNNNGTITTNNSNLGGGANTITVTGTLTNNTGGIVTIGANNDTSDVASVGLLANSGTVTVDKGATLNLTTAGANTNSSAIAVTAGRWTCRLAPSPIPALSTWSRRAPSL